MKVYTREEFAEWINEEMEKRGWTNSELARRAKISHASISQVIGGRKAGVAFCKGLARAFDIPAETIYRMAGILPTIESLDQKGIGELAEIFKHLDPDQREMVIEMARKFYAQRRRE